MKFYKRTQILFLALLSFFYGCEYLFPSLPGEKVTVDEAYNYLKKHKDDKDVVLIDVRTKEEYDKAHIQNAVLMDFKQTTFPDEIAKMDRDKRYLVYSGNDNKSANTIELMKELRFKNTHYIIGGIDEWENKGLPVNF